MRAALSRHKFEVKQHMYITWKWIMGFRTEGWVKDIRERE